MKTELVTVTPSIAKAWIDSTSSRNRSLSSARVRSYAELMKSGRWMMNGESIIIDDNGNLIDGQHRLHAVIRSGKSVQMVVVRGVDPSSFKTIDVGKKRSPGDILHVAGIPMPRCAAAITSVVYTFKSVGEFRSGINPTRTDVTNANPGYDVLIETEKLMPALMKSVAVGERWRRCKLFILPPTLPGAMHFLFSEIDQELADDFFDRMIDIRFENDRDPVKKLYIHCTERGKREIMKADNRYAGALFIKAWNLFAKNQSCPFIKFAKDEEYPVIFDPAKSRKSPQMAAAI